jgi:hypothetical protein
MTQMSTSLRSYIAEIKILVLHMSANKRGRKQRKHKDTEVASTSSAEQTGGEGIWKCMMKLLMVWKNHGTACVIQKVKEISQQGSQGYSTPSHGKPDGAYWCVSHAIPAGIHRHLPVHKQR